MLTLSEPCAICMLGPSSLQATAVGGERGGFAVDEDVGEPVTILPLGSGYRHRRRQCRRVPQWPPPGEIPHRHAGADEQHADADTRSRRAGDEQRTRRQCACGGDQAADNGAGNHAGGAWECPMVSPTRAASVIVRSFYVESSSLGRPVAAQHLQQQRVVLRRQLARHRRVNTSTRPSASANTARFCQMRLPSRR